MKNKFTLTKESCILEKWEGTSHKPISPLGIVFRISPKDEIVKDLVSQFEDYKNSLLNEDYKDFENPDYYIKLQNKFKKDCENTEIKITLKIELEKYE
jgi:hypothetical protein